MFKKILIANRGEIALRLLTACKELGCKTAIIYAQVDDSSNLLNYADEKYLIPGKPIEAYLNIDAIIQTAKQNNIDAIHPGYGFLSENYHFAKSCTENNIAFIGPNYNIIKQMGSKIESRQLMAKYNIPMVPGTITAINDIDEVKAFAQTYNYPIACKASGGGGGRGFVLINQADEIESALKKASSESLRYFGSSDIYLEKYFKEAKHIEVQIMADNYGNIITLGERDCSTQRRHQKLIEESPAASISPSVRKTLHETAIKIAKLINYNNIGTIEFLVADDKIYFLEVNSRIQVEHPVTEVTTHIDIAKEQIRLASGEKLQYSQNIIPVGHGIEFRINAENPYANFQPNFGRIDSFTVPQQPFVRVDTHCHNNYEITPYFDSLLAKLIIWGKDRNEAIQRSKIALENFKITGIETTLDFHRKIIDDKIFINDKIFTSYVETEFIHLLKSNSTQNKPSQTASKTLTANTPNIITQADQLTQLANSKSFRVKVDNEIFNVEIAEIKSSKTPLKFKQNKINHFTKPLDEEIISVKMPGLIKNILVKSGDIIKAGQKLLVIEAMKMESEIVANHDGQVDEILVKPDETVDGNATLMKIKML